MYYTVTTLKMHQNCPAPPPPQLSKAQKQQNLNYVNQRLLSHSQIKHYSTFLVPLSSSPCRPLGCSSSFSSYRMVACLHSTPRLKNRVSVCIIIITILVTFFLQRQSNTSFSLKVKYIWRVDRLKLVLSFLPSFPPFFRSANLRPLTAKFIKRCAGLFVCIGAMHR